MPSRAPTDADCCAVCSADGAVDCMAGVGARHLRSRRGVARACLRRGQTDTRAVSHTRHHADMRRRVLAVRHHTRRADNHAGARRRGAAVRACRTAARACALPAHPRTAGAQGGLCRHRRCAARASIHLPTVRDARSRHREIFWVLQKICEKTLSFYEKMW